MFQKLHAKNATGKCTVSLSKDPEHEQAENIHSGFKELLTAFNKPRNTYSLRSANRIYVEKTYPLLPVSWIVLFQRGLRKTAKKKRKSFALYSLYSLVINRTVLKLSINATDDESWFPDKLHWKIPFGLLPVYKNAFGCNAGPLFMQYSLSLGISIHTIENEILK